MQLKYFELHKRVVFADLHFEEGTHKIAEFLYSDSFIFR
jgi:hypothetical protein